MMITGRRFMSDGIEIPPALGVERSTCTQCGLPIWRDRAEPGTWDAIADDPRWYTATATKVSAHCDAGIYTGPPLARMGNHVPEDARESDKSDGLPSARESGPTPALEVDQ